LFSNVLFAQENYWKVFERSGRDKIQEIRTQFVTFIILNTDSTYSIKTYEGNVNDSKENYQNWTLYSMDGTWKIEQKSLILYDEYIGIRYKINDRFIRPRLYQIDHTGRKSISYQYWIFQKRPKYKINKRI
jgi:hypothetical protein